MTITGIGPVYGAYENVLVTIASAKTKYYEKLIISQQIISLRSNVITVQQLSVRFNFYRANYCTN